MYIKSLKKFFLLSILSMTFSFSLPSFATQNNDKSMTSSSSHVLNIQHWQTANGVPVYFVRTPGLPMLDIQVIFRAGAARDGEKYGLAQLTNSLLNEGAGNLTADQIGEKFDSVGAVFNSDVAQDMASVALRSLTDPQYLNPALQTFTTVLTSPTFQTDAFERIKKQSLVVIKMESQSPGVVASKAFLTASYPNHPYGHSETGTTDSVTALTVDDAVNFYRQYYVAKNAMIAMVGDVSIEQAKQITEQITQPLAKGNAANPIPFAPMNKSSAQHNINFPSQQTTIVLGQAAITPTDPDYFPLMVGNYILGGGPNSRLFQQVREKNGWVYSVSSQFLPMQARGPFIIFLQSRQSEAQKALQLSRSVLQDYIQKGPTNAELVDAKNHLMSSFPLTIASNANILSKIRYIGFYGLPLDYLDAWRDRINAVTEKKVQQAFQNKLSPQDMTVVTVGQE